MSGECTMRAIVEARTQMEGGGFPVRRPFPQPGLGMVDPFLLLDEMGPVQWPPGEAIGAPAHPHRGFETITILLQGEMEHQDSHGNLGQLRPGDAQWMTAGDGIIHSELPTDSFQKTGGWMHGFQIWVNLPTAHKRKPPRYQDLRAADIPTVTKQDAYSIRVIAGAAFDISAKTETEIPITVLDVTIWPGGQLQLPVQVEQSGMAYVFDGSARICSTEVLVDSGQLALFDSGSHLNLSVDASTQKPARVLYLSAAPLREPVSRYGPFVMNTREEILQAVEDYQSGKFGRMNPTG